MSDRDDRLRKLAAVRRNLDDLADEISTAEGAMPQENQVAGDGRRNFMTVVKRLDTIQELASDASDKLRSVLQDLD